MRETGAKGLEHAAKEFEQQDVEWVTLESVGPAQGEEMRTRASLVCSLMHGEGTVVAG